MQLVIYGVDSVFVLEQSIQLPNIPGAVHNITQYLITLLTPGTPGSSVIPINAIITAVDDNQTA